MRAVDTSVVVAAFSTWHEQHRAARRALDDEPAIAAHSLVESYSVLTRLPAPFRAPGELAGAFLLDRFPGGGLHPRGDVIAALAAADVVGGAAYDGLIALVARDHGATLVSLDRRAAVTYGRLGVTFAILA